MCREGPREGEDAAEEGGAVTIARSYTAAVPVWPAEDPEVRRLDEAWRRTATPRALSRVVTRSMIERYGEGLSLAQIAREFGVTRQTVFQRLRGAGAALRPLPPRGPTVEHGGRLFTPTKGGYLRATSGDRALLHRILWEERHGPVPPGQEVFHRNGNPRDNRPENLYLLDRRDRSRLRQPVEAKACPVCGRPVERHPGEGPAAYRRRRCCGYRCGREDLRRRKGWPARGSVKEGAPA